MNVSVTTSPAGMPGMVLVKVTATNVTVPYGAPDTCVPGTPTALLERDSGGSWVFEAGPQSMTGNITTGYETTFASRPSGTFRGTVSIIWQVTHPESASAVS